MFGDVGLVGNDQSFDEKLRMGWVYIRIHHQASAGEELNIFFSIVRSDQDCNFAVYFNIFLSAL